MKKNWIFSLCLVGMSCILIRAHCLLSVHWIQLRRVWLYLYSSHRVFTHTDKVPEPSLLQAVPASQPVAPVYRALSCTGEPTSAHGTQTAYSFCTNILIFVTIAEFLPSTIVFQISSYTLIF